MLGINKEEQQNDRDRDLKVTEYIRESFLDKILWVRISRPETEDDFIAAWLTLQCHLIPAITRAVVVTGPPDQGPYVPSACWPADERPVPGITEVAEIAMAERRSVVKGFHRSEREQLSAESSCYVAQPVFVDNKLYGVVSVEMDACSENELHYVVRKLQWGTVWLEAAYRRRLPASQERSHSLLVSVVQNVALCLEYDEFRSAATSFVTQLATELVCDRVSIGFGDGKRMQVEAISNSANFHKQANLVRAIGAAMDEVLDQRCTIRYPDNDDDEAVISRSHAEMAKYHGSGNICTIPIIHHAAVTGAVMLERQADRPFDRETVELCEHIVSLSGGVLDIKRKENRSLVARARDSLVAQFKALTGPGHPALKFFSGLAVLLIAALFLAEGTYRVTASAKLQGSVERVIVAPYTGYIAEARVKAGDRVNENDILVVLDDKDQIIERAKWASQKEQFSRQHLEAMANHDRAQIRILSAKIAQAEAQINLLDEQISRSRISAPFNSLVVSGDLTQSLGEPVEKGDILYKVAPLEAYRVMLDIDEHDVSELRAGQEGNLVLTSVPGVFLPFVIERITPVTSSGEGKNTFKTEARLLETAQFLRPGMLGTGKVTIEDRKLLWIWTHRLIDWLRLQIWMWLS
jgi:hypothetical protein